METDQETESPSPEARGDRRGTERRSGDRRRDDRRLPPPVWRRPAAYVGYGVLGTILLVTLLRGAGSDEIDPRQQAAIIERTAMADPEPSPPTPAVPAREAFTVAQYERLIAEGESAVGEVVRTELYCGSINQVSVRDPEQRYPVLATLADSEGRVAGAECRWSREARSSDFLLIVPPHLAEEFARAPEVELNFVRRRQIPANVEWLGRAEALSLRNAGVLREIVS